MLFWLVGPKKINVVQFRTSERMCVPSFIDLCLRITKLQKFEIFSISQLSGWSGWMAK